MSWWNIWWLFGYEQEEPKPKKFENTYKVVDGVEIHTDKVYLCPELLKLKKESLKEVIPVPPPTPENKRIERTLKRGKKRLRKKRKNLYSEYRDLLDVVSETG